MLDDTLPSDPYAGYELLGDHPTQPGAYIVKDANGTPQVVPAPDVMASPTLSGQGALAAGRGLLASDGASGAQPSPVPVSPEPGSPEAAQAALNGPPTGVPAPPVVLGGQDAFQPGVFKGNAAKHPLQKELFDLQEQARAKQYANTQEANVVSEQAQQRQVAEQAAEDRTRQIQAEGEKRFNDAMEAKKAADALTVDPNKAVNDMSWAQRGLMFLSVASGGFYSGFTGRENPGMKMLNDDIDRSIDAQKTNIAAKQRGAQSALELQMARNREIFGNDAAAKQMQHGMMLEQFASQLEATKLSSNNPAIAAAALVGQDEARKEAAKYYLSARAMTDAHLAAKTAQDEAPTRIEMAKTELDLGKEKLKGEEENRAAVKAQREAAQAFNNAAGDPTAKDAYARKLPPALQANLIYHDGHAINLAPTKEEADKINNSELVYDKAKAALDKMDTAYARAKKGLGVWTPSLVSDFNSARQDIINLRAQASDSESKGAGFRNTALENISEDLPGEATNLNLTAADLAQLKPHKLAELRTKLSAGLNSDRKAHGYAHLYDDEGAADSTKTYNVPDFTKLR